MPSPENRRAKAASPPRAAGDPVDRRGMGVNDVGLGEKTVHEGLDRRTLVLAGPSGGHEIGEGGRLSGLGILRIARAPDRIEPRPVDRAESGFAYRGQGAARCLHVESLSVLERGVASAGEDPFGVGAVAAGKGHESTKRGHSSAPGGEDAALVGLHGGDETRIEPERRNAGNTRPTLRSTAGTLPPRGGPAGRSRREPRRRRRPRRGGRRLGSRKAASSALRAERAPIGPGADPIDRCVEVVEADADTGRLARARELSAEIGELVGQGDDVVGVPADAAAHVEEDAGHEGQDGAELVGDALGRMVVAHVEGEEFPRVAA